jgi:hypothetical protein
MTVAEGGERVKARYLNHERDVFQDLNLSFKIFTSGNSSAVKAM